MQQEGRRQTCVCKNLTSANRTEQLIRDIAHFLSLSLIHRLSQVPLTPLTTIQLTHFHLVPAQQWYDVRRHNNANASASGHAATVMVVTVVNRFSKDSLETVNAVSLSIDSWSKNSTSQRPLKVKLSSLSC